MKEHTTQRLDHELFDTEQAAAHLAVKPHTLEVWRVSGRYSLPFIRVGRRVRYRRKDLDHFLDTRTVRALGDAEVD